MTGRSEKLSEQREQIKGSKLEYAYIIPSDYAHLPLLGSAIRGLGKGWRVGVYGEERIVESFERLQSQLLVPENLQINKKVAELDLLLIGILDEEKIREIQDDSEVLGKAHVMVAHPFPGNDFDLISRFSQNIFSEKGVVAITGSGKGKTTTALGMATQSIISGEKIAVVQWFKERKSGRMTWSINEHYFPELLKDPKRMTFEPTGVGFFGSPTMDRVNEYEDHKKNAYQGLQRARELILSGEYAVVVLDEFVDTVPEIAQNIEVPLIDLKDVQEMLALCATQNRTKIVITGRRITDHWVNFIGTSWTIDEIKHPWSSKHAGAISGLDF